MMAKKKSSVIIIIPNFNGYNDLSRCLDSIATITYPSLKTIVFDNHSTTDDVQQLKKNYPWVTVFSFKKNYSFAEGYNNALSKIGKTDYVFLVNNDTILNNSIIQTMVSFAEMNRDIAIIQPKIKSISNPKYFEYAGAAGGFVDKLGYPYCRGRLVFHVEKDKGQYDSTSDIFWASGAAMFCRFEIIKKVGFFDKDLEAYVEEHDLCWRVLLQGYRIVCYPKAVILHKGMGSWQYFKERKTYLIHRNNLLVLIKNIRVHRLLIILPLRILMDYLAIFYYIKTGYPQFAFPVLHAHIDVIRMFKRFWNKRDIKKNEERIKYLERNLMKPKSIIFEYFIRRKRTYMQLINE